MLPQSAVLSDEQGNYVYIIDSKNQVERRNIKIGNVGDSGVTIAQGLSGNEIGRPFRRSVPQSWPESEAQSTGCPVSSARKA